MDCTSVCLASRHSRICEPLEDSLDGEQLRSPGHFHPLALSPSQSLGFYHSAAVAFPLWSIRSLTVSLKLPQKLPIQFGVCYRSATKTSLLYLHLTTVTSSNKPTHVHDLACSSESQGCGKEMATFSLWPITAAHVTCSRLVFRDQWQLLSHGGGRRDWAELPWNRDEQFVLFYTQQVCGDEYFIPKLIIPIIHVSLQYNVE